MAPLLAPEKQVATPPRIPLPDTLRGLCVLLMCLYHFAYDLYFVCGFSRSVIERPLISMMQILSSRGFILLAGCSCRLSRSNLRRGGKVLVCGLGVSVITWLWGDFIPFGILHFLGASMLLYALLAPMLERLPAAPSFAVYIILFMLAYAHFPRLTSLPWLFPMGWVTPHFYASDYWPMLPWLFLFLAGTVCGTWLSRLPRPLSSLSVPGLTFLGRHALAVYLIHQPVLVGVCLLGKRLLSP